MAFYSIIVPTFNSGNTLRKCIESVLNQSYEDLELIISDGFSTDSTRKIAESYQDHRIKIFSEKDSGVYDAMNKAIDKTKGRWLLFLGSDDLLYDDKVLEEMKKNLDHTAARLVYGDVKIVGNSSWAQDGQIYMGEAPLAMLFEQNICHQAIFYSKAIFDDNLRYNLDYRICADYDFNLFCASKYEMEYFPVIVSSFMGGGLSSVDMDDAFSKDRWLNIVRYFRGKLFDKSLVQYRNPIKKTWKTFFKLRQFNMVPLVLALYLYYKFKKS